jgi:hypothetical protein
VRSIQQQHTTHHDALNPRDSVPRCMGGAKVELLAARAEKQDGREAPEHAGGGLVDRHHGAMALEANNEPNRTEPWQVMWHEQNPTVM